jgi:hypothetical protein
MVDDVSQMKCDGAVEDLRYRTGNNSQLYE